MLKSQYIEDLYIKFYQSLLHDFWQVPSKEAEALSSFYILCVDNKPFTEKQAGYMLTLMKKYKDIVLDNNADDLAQIENPKFKHLFRVIDENKKFYIEKDSNNGIFMCFKFPYVFKAIFDKEISQLTENKNAFKFDTESQARKINFHLLNPIIAYEFALTHNFEIDESVLQAVAEAETAWSNQEHLMPKTEIINNMVVVESKNQYVDQYFKEHATGNYYQDLFLAKSMGYPVILEKSPENIIEKIASSKTNIFWLQENNKIFELYKILNCKIAIILDRNENTDNWIKEFTGQAENYGILREKIKVCFRDKSEFNNWIRDNGHGGKVELGDIYIFDHKPAKWLFKDPNFVKIVVTTTKFMPTAPITKELINTHPCAIYLSDIKPTVKGNTKLVKL